MPRLGIGPIAVSDGPHGLRKQSGASDNLGLTGKRCRPCAFPRQARRPARSTSTSCARVGRALGDEAPEQGVAVLLGPGVNMKRSPLCGRNFEYFSEDPYLAGCLGAAYVEGVRRGVGTSLKHLACNNQRPTASSWSTVVDERALHELYLEPFRIVVERARPWT